MWRELGEIAQVGSGYPFRGKIQNDPGGELVILQQRDISEMAAMPPERLAGLAPEGAARARPESGFEKYRLPAGAVLLQVRGAQFLAVVFEGDYPAIAAQGVAVLKPEDGVCPRFLCWVLNHPRTTEGLRAVAGGTHIPFISKKALAAYRVPVPPPAVQERIVAADDIRARHRAATRRLIELNDQLVDAATWQAATSDQ